MVGKTKCQRLSSAKSLRYETWESVPWWDRTTAALCPEQGLHLFKTHTRSRKRSKLHSTRLRKNGYSRLRQQKSRRKESLLWIPELVCIWSARKTFTLWSWRRWAYRNIQRRWWRPTARCKPQREVTVISKNWTCSSKLFFSKKTPVFFFFWRNSVGIMGFHVIGSAVRNHISTGMFREFIAI